MALSDTMRAIPLGGAFEVSSGWIPPNPFAEVHGVLSMHFQVLGLGGMHNTDQLWSRERRTEDGMRFTKC